MADLSPFARELGKLLRKQLDYCLENILMVPLQDYINTSTNDPLPNVHALKKRLSNREEDLAKNKFVTDALNETKTARNCVAHYNYQYIFDNYCSFLTAFINLCLYMDHLDAATAIASVKGFTLKWLIEESFIENLQVHKLSEEDQALYWKLIQTF